MKTSIKAQKIKTIIILLWLHILCGLLPLSAEIHNTEESLTKFIDGEIIETTVEFIPSSGTSRMDIIANGGTITFQDSSRVIQNEEEFIDEEFIETTMEFIPSSGTSRMDFIANGGTISFQETSRVDGDPFASTNTIDSGILKYLTEEAAAGDAYYGEYTVMAKGITTIRLYDHGQGKDVPIMGNDTSAFVVTTTEWQGDSLEPVLSVVEVLKLPTTLHESTEFGLKISLPDGDVLYESISTVYPIMSDIDFDCEASGDSLSSAITSSVSTINLAQSWVNTVEVELFTSMVTALSSTLLMPTEGEAVGASVIVAGDQAAMREAVGNIAESMTPSLYNTIGESICAMLSDLEAPLPALSERYFSPNIQNQVQVDASLICLDTKIDAVLLENDNDDQKVPGEIACTEWLIEIHVE